MLYGQPTHLPPYRFDYAVLASFTGGTDTGPLYYPTLAPSVLADGGLVTLDLTTGLPLVPYARGPGMGTYVVHDDSGDPGAPTPTSGLLQGYDATADPAFAGRLLYPLRGVFNNTVRPADAQFVNDYLVPQRVGQFWNSRVEACGLPFRAVTHVVLYAASGPFASVVIDPDTFAGGEIVVVMPSGNGLVPEATPGVQNGLDQLVANTAQVAAGVTACARFLAVIVHAAVWSGNPVIQANYEAIHAAHVAALVAGNVPFVVREIPFPQTRYLSDGLYTQDLVDFFTPP